VLTGGALVTVITPAYNVGKWVGAAIDSVLRQTEDRFEYIVVDDGSTDDTADVVSGRVAGDGRLRLISTANAGSAEARNVGLAQVRTPFVAFLDGDDIWHKDFLRWQLAAMQSAPAGVGATFCHTRVMLESGQVVGLRLQPTGFFDLDRLLVENNPTHNGSSLLIRRSCFDEVGVFDASLSSCIDFDMWLRIADESSTPLFWGHRRFLVDMRLMRTGSISSNRPARLGALDKIIATYAPKMTRLPPDLAYVRPAVLAYRDGFDEFGNRWAVHARKTGSAVLGRTLWGLSVLAWSHAGPKGRLRLRALRNSAWTGMYRGLAFAAILTRIKCAPGRVSRRAPGSPPG
jgi:glycosyltransferase involved in cell wall biosynthesis